MANCRANMNQIEKERRVNAVRLFVGVRDRSRKSYETHLYQLPMAAATTLMVATRGIETSVR